jgi:probable addiction module antidote protein
MSSKVTTFDVSEYLKDEASVAAYLSAIVEEDDPSLLLSAIGDIAKARGCQPAHVISRQEIKTG